LVGFNFWKYSLDLKSMGLQFLKNSRPEPNDSFKSQEQSNTNSYLHLVLDVNILSSYFYQIILP
jgi:hypothetical protein